MRECANMRMIVRLLRSEIHANGPVQLDSNFHHHSQFDYAPEM